MTSWTCWPRCSPDGDFVHIDSGMSLRARQLDAPMELDRVQAHAGDYLVEGGTGLLLVDRRRFESAYARPRDFPQT